MELYLSILYSVDNQTFDCMSIFIEMRQRYGTAIVPSYLNLVTDGRGAQIFGTIKPYRITVFSAYQPLFLLHIH